MRITTSQSPLSPHLHIYKPQLTSMMSILHRITGFFLALSACFWVYWLVAIAAGPTLYQPLQHFLNTWPGQLLLLGWSIAFCYHLSNGIRHLFWDMGIGFSLKTVYASGKLVGIVTIMLTGLIWGLIG